MGHASTVELIKLDGIANYWCDRVYRWDSEGCNVQSRGIAIAPFSVFLLLRERVMWR